MTSPLPGLPEGVVDFLAARARLRPDAPPQDGTEAACTEECCAPFLAEVRLLAPPHAVSAEPEPDLPDSHLPDPYLPDSYPEELHAHLTELAAQTLPAPRPLSTRLYWASLRVLLVLALTALLFHLVLP